MQVHHLLTFFSCFFLSAEALQTHQSYFQQPLPVPCTGPSCVSDFAKTSSGGSSSLQYQDTTVIKHHQDGTYYRISKGNDTGMGLNVVTAPTLSGPWNYQGTILGDNLKSPCGAFDAHKSSWRWAPEIHFIKGLYYLYYTVEYPGGGAGGNTCFDQCVATSKDMKEWEDVGSMGIPNPKPVLASNGKMTAPYVALDGNLLVNSTDPQGADGLYMTFGSYQFGIYGIHLQNLTHVKDEEPELVIAAQYQEGGNFTEGPYQLIHNDYIYLFYSRGSCCSAPSAALSSVYETQVCRTPIGFAPKYVDKDGEDCLTGGKEGWHRKGTTFLYSNGANGASSSVFAPGSVGVMNDEKEGLVMWYQYQDNTSGKANIGFGWNRLSFDKDDWPILMPA